jgi:hypothetical protein
MFGAGLFSTAPVLLQFLIALMQSAVPNYADKIKYFGCIFIIFPQMLLVGLFNYKNIELLRKHAGDVKGNEVYVPDKLYSELVKQDPKTQFAFLGLEDVSYNNFFYIFIVSLLVNIVGALYLFNRHVNAELRLRMK